MKSVRGSAPFSTPHTTVFRQRVSTRHLRTIETFAAKNEAHCYVNKDGHLVCDILPPGDYVVKHSDQSETSPAPTDETVAFCYITESGELISEDLPEGNYTIEQANDEQMKEILTRMEKITEPDETDDSEPVIKSEEEEMSKESFDPETGVYCYVNADGAMVCEKLEPGDYVVKPMPGERTEPRAEKKDDDVMFCYITDDGELICEGMEEGKYRIERATDDDLSNMLKHVEKITGTEKTL